MKKLFVLVGLFTVLFATAQPQDTLYVWKAGVLVNIQSIKTADMDSITFKRPPVNPNGINIPGPNVTDIDGNVYASVTNCGQTWTKQNLNVSKYSDGTPIPQVTDPTQWANLTTGAWCYYANNTVNGPVYGKLYNWYAVAGIYDAASLANPALRKNLAPTGWHIPTDPEWTQLTNCLGGESVAGGKMKATGTIQEATGFWESPNTEANNSSGFNGLPGGLRKKIDITTFLFVPYSGNWWSSTEYSTTSVWYRKLDFNTGFSITDKHVKTSGCSLRCVKD
jgi:uncharacterized protein (TIGR02145 family)